MAANGSKDAPLDVAVAAKPTNFDAVSSLVKELAAGVESLAAGGLGINEVLRQDLSVKARDIMLALETPRETSMKHLWGEVRVPLSLNDFWLFVTMVGRNMTID